MHRNLKVMLKNKIINGVLLGVCILCESLIGETYEIYLQKNDGNPTTPYEVQVVINGEKIPLPQKFNPRRAKVVDDVFVVSCFELNDKAFPGYSGNNSFFGAIEESDEDDGWSVYDFKMIQVAIDSRLNRIAICPRQKPEKAKNPGRVEQLVVKGFPHVCLCSNLPKREVFFLQDIGVESAESFYTFSMQSDYGEHGLAFSALKVDAEHCDFGGEISGATLTIQAPVVHFLENARIRMDEIHVANFMEGDSSLINEGNLATNGSFTVQGIKCLTNAKQGVIDIPNVEFHVNTFANDGTIDVSGKLYQAGEVPTIMASTPKPAPVPPAQPKTLTYYTFQDNDKIFKKGDFRKVRNFYPIPSIFHYREGGNDSRWSSDSGNIKIMEYFKNTPTSCPADIPGLIQKQGVADDHVDYMVIVCRVRDGETVCNYFTHLWSMDRMYMGTKTNPKEGDRTTIVDSGVFKAHNIQIINNELGNGGLVAQSQVFHDGDMLSGNCARFNITAFPADGWFVSIYNASKNIGCGNVEANQFNRAVVIHWYFVRDGMAVTDPWLKSVLDNWGDWRKISQNPVRLLPQFQPQ